MNAIQNVTAGIVVLAEMVCELAGRVKDKGTASDAMKLLAELLASCEQLTVKAAPVAEQKAAPATVKAVPDTVKAAVKLGPDTPAPAAGIDESVDLDTGKRARGGKRRMGKGNPDVPVTAPVAEDKSAALSRILGQVRADRPAPAPVKVAVQKCDKAAAPATVKESADADAYAAELAAKRKDKAAKLQAAKKREELASRNAAANNANARKVDMSDLPTYGQAESERVLLCCVLVELGVRAQLAAKFTGRDAWMEIARLRQEVTIARAARTAPIGELPRS